MGVLAWIVGLLLTAGFAMSGFGKLRGLEMMNATRDRLGVSDSLWKAIGGLEILGAVGVFIGLLSSGDAELVGTAAAIGLIATMVGALIHHVKAGDPAKEMAGAVVMSLLSILYIVLLGLR